MQNFIMLSLTFLCNMSMYFNLFDFFFLSFFSIFTLHLGTDKWMCSLMCQVSLCVHLPGWKRIKFPLIWYIILLDFITVLYEKSEFEKVFIFFLLLVYINPEDFFFLGGGGLISSHIKPLTNIPKNLIRSAWWPPGKNTTSSKQETFHQPCLWAFFLKSTATTMRTIKILLPY